MGSSLEHKFVECSAQGPDFEVLPKTSTKTLLDYLLEVYVDDYVALAIPCLQEQLRHVAIAIMMGVHDVFQPVEVD